MEDSEELARARLAYISAGRPPLGAPRRAAATRPQAAEALDAPVAHEADDGDEVAARAASVANRSPLARGLEAARSITVKHALVVAVLLAAASGVTVFALSQSSATEVPITPVAVVSPPPPTPTPVPMLRVHVAGAVRTPGVVSLPAGAIVQDALLAAGGLAEDADPAELNLAAPVADGMQVLIGSTSEPQGEILAPAGAAPGADEGGLLNLNTATQAQLEELPDIGPVTAEAILAWREEHGKFSAVEELQEIAGIGPKTYSKLSSLVTT